MEFAEEKNHVDPIQFQVAYAPMDPTIPEYSENEIYDLEKGHFTV